MALDNFINNKNNVLISIKEINVSSNKHIYIYGINCLCESVIKCYDKDCRVIFLDKYIDSKYILIQKDDNFNDYITPELDLRPCHLSMKLCFDFSGLFVIISNEKIDPLCSKIDLINHSNKIYIITYYNTIHRCLMRHIIFDKNNLE